MISCVSRPEITKENATHERSNQNACVWHWNEKRPTTTTALNELEQHTEHSYQLENYIFMYPSCCRCCSKPFKNGRNDERMEKKSKEMGFLQWNAQQTASERISSEKCDGYKVYERRYNVPSAMQLYIVVSHFFSLHFLMLLLLLCCVPFLKNSKTDYYH